MKKKYPYLQDSFNATENMNEAGDRRNFLAQLDNFVNQKQYVNITLLNWQEDPIKEIQGELTSGSIGKDGTSCIRRTCTLQCSVNGTEYSVEDSEMDFAINKKIFIEVGIKNYTNQYKDWPILWFPQGVFFISSFNISTSATGSVNISLNLKDKMAGLTGDVGGKFPATVVLDEMETQTPDGDFATEKVLIYNIIQELVNHWGGEDINNIVIEDVPLRIRRVMKWTGNTPLWLQPQNNTAGGSLDLWYEATTTPPSNYNGIVGHTKKKFLTYEEFDSYIKDKYHLNDPEKIREYEEKIAAIEKEFNKNIQAPAQEVEKLKNKLTDAWNDLQSLIEELGLSEDNLHFIESANLDGTERESYLEWVDLPQASANIENTMTDETVQTLLETFDVFSAEYPPALQLAIDKYNTWVDDVRRYTNEIRKLEKAKNNELAMLNAMIDNIKSIIIDEDGNIEIEEGDSVIQDVDIWESNDQTIQITNGTDAGYIFDDFYYTGELVMNAGQSVTDALDEIKNYLGNYEYFYDEFGVFHFQEIKNYLNTTQGKIVLSDMSKKDYLVETTIPKNVYTFSDDANLISLTANPQYENIKNDYIVQGEKQVSEDFVYPVRYHLAIDRKPIPGSSFEDLLLYREELTNMVKAAFPVHIEDELPLPGNFNLIYEKDGAYYFWDDTLYKEVEVVQYYDHDNPYITKDWRTELYLQGMLNKNYNTSAGNYYNDFSKKNISAVLDTTNTRTDIAWIGNIYQKTYTQKLDIDFYFEELDAFWPQIYDLEKQAFIGFDEDSTIYTSSLTDGIYYLDFIDPNESGLGEFSVANIGRRTNVTDDDNINCLFQPNIPDIVFLNTDDENIAELRQECIDNGQPFTQVTGDMYLNFATGGYKNGAFDQIKYDLLIHTNYQKTVSIMALPVFYLEPNTRATLNDKSTNTYGDYIISSITIPLGGGDMSVSGSECFEKI